MCQRQLWKGKLKSLWVQKGMEERLPSPALPSPQGPTQVPGMETMEFPGEELPSSALG